MRKSSVKSLLAVLFASVLLPVSGVLRAQDAANTAATETAIEIAEAAAVDVPAKEVAEAEAAASEPVNSPVEFDAPVSAEAVAANVAAKSANPDVSTATKMTIEEVRIMALKQSPTIAAAAARIDAAKATVAAAFSRYLPSVDIESGITRYRDKRTERNSGEKFDSYTNYAGDLVVTYTLFDGFKRYYDYISAQAGENAELANYDDARRILLQAVSSAFYTCLLEKDNMKIARDDADFNKILLSDAKNRYNAGVAMQSEVLNFELHVGNAEVDYLAAERAWRNAMVVLGQLLALEDLDNIWEKIDLVPPPSEELFREVNLSEMHEYSLLNRPDLQMIDEQIVAANADLESARSNWFPVIDAYGRYGYERHDKCKFSNAYDRNIDFGVTMTWNLFEGGATMARMDYARALIDELQQQRSDMLLKITSEIDQNYETLMSSRQQLILQDKNLDVAIRIRDLTHSEYLAGTTTITRLNEVQTDVTINASARSQAYIQVLNGLDDLAASTGRILEITIPKDTPAVKVK